MSLSPEKTTHNNYPSYLKLFHSGELKRRVKESLEELKECRLCPRDCGIDRTRTNNGECNTGRYAVVSGAFPHFGEEDCLRGIHGSGAIYFANCNMDCVFCKNKEESSVNDSGLALKAESLAVMMMDLQNKGCHNLNLISPEHVVPQILEALEIAVENGFHLPIVYNSSSYNSTKSLKYLDGIVDLYAADFKFWDQNLSEKYLKAKDYPQKARESILSMFEQVGDLLIGEDGIAVKGLLIRHLIMPDFTGEVKQILDYIVEKISKNTYVHLINKYHPAGDVSQKSYSELNRKLNFDEYDEVLAIARKAGIERLAESRSIFSILDDAKK
ncbi:MAG: radical SAM protein [Spirochaetia bacterium]|nr:radical SAM protein [Spirochaetia bacterium]